MGCSPSQKDSDNDGVNDANDQCPGHDDTVDTDGDGTPDGCDTADSDNDGVENNVDQCPSTPTSETADNTGCSPSQKDSDNDGINDANDQCPGHDDTVDTDGDGTPDGCDGAPPQVGIDSLTATLGASGVIDLSWNIANSQLTGANDYGVLYVNDDGAALDGTRSTFDLTTTTHAIAGTHGTTYEFLVRVENGEVGTDGSALYGTPVDSGSATADGQVDPTAEAADLESVSWFQSIHFTWSALYGSDVDHWMICWSPEQHTSLEVSSLITAGNCHTTADSAMDVTMDRHSGSGVFYYSVVAVDSVGNIETADSSAGLRFSGATGPGVNVDDTIWIFEGEDGDGEAQDSGDGIPGFSIVITTTAMLGALIFARKRKQF
jgi:hypothetical protein